MPFIFEKPLSKVKTGRLYCIAVAAISASANGILRFCLSAMVASLISRLYGIRIQSSKSALQFFVCDDVIPGMPKISISVTKEMASNFSMYGVKRMSPSSRLMRIFVSARKSILTPCFLLVFQSIQTTLQSSEMLFKRRLSLSLVLLQFG
jgi:hypothetical protein